MLIGHHFHNAKTFTCLRSLKIEVYELSFCGCNSTYVRQSCRHFATRLSEHQITDSPVEQHVVECCGALMASNYKIIGIYSFSAPTT